LISGDEDGEQEEEEEESKESLLREWEGCCPARSFMDIRHERRVVARSLFVPASSPLTVHACLVFCVE